MIIQVHSEFTYPDESPGFLLWQVSNLWQMLQRKALSELNLTHVQFALLSGIGALETKERPVNQTALSKHVGADVMMTSKVLRKLETRGLVERYREPSDPRAFSLSLTDEGRVMIKNALKIVSNEDADFFKNITENKPVLIGILKELIGQFQRNG